MALLSEAAWALTAFRSHMGCQKVAAGDRKHCLRAGRLKLVF